MVYSARAGALAAIRCIWDSTEAGMGREGAVVASRCGDGAWFLQEGIWRHDPRIALPRLRAGDRTEESLEVAPARFCSSMGIRSFTPQVTACPGCGRTTSNILPGNGRADSKTYLREQMPVVERPLWSAWKR